MERFIFDVDGTLTPSRQKMNVEFQRWFLEFTYSNNVYLVTGSDYEKTVEQIGSDICENVKKVYNCSGSDVYEAGTNVYTTDWKLPEIAEQFLTQCMNESEFPLRTGLHFEHRPGMCNFSVVGRNATVGERKLYVEHDLRINERDRIARAFETMFPEISAKVGGETGIDVFPKGNDKSQILRDFSPNDTLHFFGDAMYPEGNDYPLKKQIIDNDLGICYNIKNWEDTWNRLRNV